MRSGLTRRRYASYVCTNSACERSACTAWRRMRIAGKTASSVSARMPRSTAAARTSLKKDWNAASSFALSVCCCASAAPATRIARSRQRFVNRMPPMIQAVLAASLRASFEIEQLYTPKLDWMALALQRDIAARERRAGRFLLGIVAVDVAAAVRDAAVLDDG